MEQHANGRSQSRFGSLAVDGGSPALEHAGWSRVPPGGRPGPAAVAAHWLRSTAAASQSAADRQNAAAGTERVHHRTIGHPNDDALWTAADRTGSDLRPLARSP